MACTSYRNRLIVSARTKSAGCTLFEYATDGGLVGNVTSGTLSDSMGSIVEVVAGSSHIMCCGNTGNIMFTRDVPGSSEWESPLLVSTHDASIRHACVVAYAGMDVFFSMDRKGFLGVNMLDDMETIRSITNPPFTSFKITSMVVFKQHLYIGLGDGNVMVLDVSMFLDGSVSSAVNLKNHVVKIKQCLSRNVQAGIEAMCVYSSNAYLDLWCEDQARKDEQLRQLRSKSSVEFEEKTSFDALEGHVLLVGGNDVLPVIKVMTPYARGIREVAELRGHERAVTQICADAAGRFIVSASSSEHRILIWDALTFICEGKLDDVSVGAMTLGLDCLLVATAKAPFIRMWRVPEEKMRVLSKEEKQYEEAKAIIGMTRSMRWCFGMLRPGAYIPGTAVSKPAYLDPAAHSVVKRWIEHYPIEVADGRGVAAMPPSPTTRLWEPHDSHDKEPRPDLEMDKSITGPLGVIWEGSGTGGTGRGKSLPPPSSLVRTLPVLSLEENDEDENQETEGDEYNDEDDDGEGDEFDEKTGTLKEREVFVRTNVARRTTLARTGRFSHYSDDEDTSESENDDNDRCSGEKKSNKRNTPKLPAKGRMSVPLGLGRDGLMNFQRQENKRAQEKKKETYLKHVAARQSLLRPRMVVHLLDQDSDSDDGVGIGGAQNILANKSSAFTKHHDNKRSNQRDDSSDESNDFGAPLGKSNNELAVSSSSDED
jgi:hypothetical protein